MKRTKTIRRRKKKQNSRRLPNYGEGDLFNFHGAFTEKADALKKEKATPGAFIRTMWFKGGPRYAVLTRKNPKARKKNSVVWGGTKRKNWLHPEELTSAREIRRWYISEKLPIPARFQTSADVSRAKAQWKKYLADRRERRKQQRLALRAKTKGKLLQFPSGLRLNGRRKNMTIAWGTGDQKFVHQALQQLFPSKRINQLTPAQLSRVLQLAQVLKVAKKNPVRKVAGGWRAIGPKGRMGPVLPTQRDAEIYAESLKMANPRRRNYADATELYKKFHGKGAGRVTDTGLPTADYGDHPELGQLGRLISLTIGDEEAEKPWKKKIEWKGSEAPDLAAEPGGRQLYLIGGSQDLNGSLETLPIDTDKDMLDLGFAYQIEYFTQKKFDNFQPITYYHDLGEETGDHPRVVYDRVKKRIHIVGGAYEVKPEGIVN